MFWTDWLLIVLVLVGVPLLIVVFPLYLLFGGLHSFARRPLEKCFQGIETHNQLLPGDVSFVYHTYRGLLVWVTQNEHRIYAPRADAEKLLSRLLRFNLTWGMMSYGLLFIPILALSNYYAQRRSISQQSAEAQPGTLN